MSKRRSEEREMLTRNVSLPVELDNLVQTYLNSGMFANYSEVIRNAIRMMHASDEEQRLRLEMMRQGLQLSKRQAKNRELLPVDLAQIKVDANRSP